MKQKKDAWIFLTVFLLAAASMLGCKKDESHEASSLRWTEDVRLPDGRVITLTRYQEFKGPHELGQPPSASNYWFEFSHPSSGINIRWEQSGAPYLIPVALMIDGRYSFLLTMPGVGMAWEAYKCPNPIFILFKKVDGRQWVQADLSELPVKKVSANLTYAPEERRQEIEQSHRHLSVGSTSHQINGGRKFELNFSGVVQSFNEPPCKWRDTSRDAL